MAAQAYGEVVAGAGRAAGTETGREEVGEDEKGQADELKPDVEYLWINLIQYIYKESSFGQVIHHRQHVIFYANAIKKQQRHP